MANCCLGVGDLVRLVGLVEPGEVPECPGAWVKYKLGWCPAVVPFAERLEVGADDKALDFDLRIQARMGAPCHPEQLFLQCPSVMVERPRSISDVGVAHMGLPDPPEAHRVETR